MKLITYKTRRNLTEFQIELIGNITMIFSRFSPFIKSKRSISVGLGYTRRQFGYKSIVIPFFEFTEQKSKLWPMIGLLLGGISIFGLASCDNKRIQDDSDGRESGNMLTKTFVADAASLVSDSVVNIASKMSQWGLIN